MAVAFVRLLFLLFLFYEPGRSVGQQKLAGNKAGLILANFFRKRLHHDQAQLYSQIVAKQAHKSTPPKGFARVHGRRLRGESTPVALFKNPPGGRPFRLGVFFSSDHASETTSSVFSI
ncbi:MAG: hypothetical protein KatS3mg105_1046 [Gemmatales bacterium]|nr:MAG: hypothetical protein KatS3mg105_1046 [Gemmatales bacterium]